MQLQRVWFFQQVSVYCFACHQPGTTVSSSLAVLLCTSTFSWLCAVLMCKYYEFKMKNNWFHFAKHKHIEIVLYYRSFRLNLPLGCVENFFFRRWCSSYLASCLSIVTSYLSPVLFGVCNEVQHKRTQFRVNEEGGTKNLKAMWHFSSIHSMHVSSVDTLWSVVVFFRIFSINAFHFIYFYRSFCSLHSWCELLPYPLQIFRLNDQRCNFFSLLSLFC